MDKIKALKKTEDRARVAQVEIRERLSRITKDDPEIMALFNDSSVLSFYFYFLHFVGAYPRIWGCKSYLEKLIRQYAPKDQS